MPMMKEVKTEWIQYTTAVATKDGNGKTTYAYKRNVKFINPVVVNVDGQNYYARDIIFFSSSDDGWFYANFPDGYLEPIFDLNQIENFYPEDEFIFNDLEDYIELFNLQPDENGMYNMTREQIIELVVNDFQEDVAKQQSK